VQEDVYRVVSEALHNVVKHANATTVEVTVAAEAPDLVVRVVDDGDGESSGADDGPLTRERLGLLSMRERTERWGGRFEAGPCPDRGWLVRAAVPLRRVGVEPAG
jgi:signal transduction histidine kinase